MRGFTKRKSSDNGELICGIKVALADFILLELYSLSMRGADVCHGDMPWKDSFRFAQAQSMCSK